MSADLAAAIAAAHRLPAGQAVRAADAACTPNTPGAAPSTPPGPIRASLPSRALCRLHAARAAQLLLASLLCLAPAAAATAQTTGPAAASAPAPVLRADYDLRDAQGTRRLTLLRSADRIEYRIAGQAIEVWRRTPDGIARLELFPEAGRSIAWSPGDLRTVGEARDWPQLASPVDPRLRQRLQAHGATRVRDHAGTRYRGDSAEGGRIELDWSEALDLPLRYRAVPARGSAPDAAYELRLRSLDRDAGHQAFTATDGYRETDYADLGDMALDPFAARYLREQGHGHAH